MTLKLAWINQLECWFAELNLEQIQRGGHRSTAKLETDKTAFIDPHNEIQKPYKWVKSAHEILASLKHFCQRTLQDLCDEF